MTLADSSNRGDIKPSVADRRIRNIWENEAVNLDRTLAVQLCEGAALLFAVIVIVAVPIVGQWRRRKR